ncbi:MAG: hypothetical protein APR63_02875 [Desulfuromonas sp. SDB]|nr:MAG: hypothetical protein APR63_02875 [Desulfuromonas sp. SDB]
MFLVIEIADFTGTAIFAVTGALAAGKKRMDIFGAVVLGCVTAIGGGTLRDIILGEYPVFWILKKEYLIIAAIAAFITFMTARYWERQKIVLLYADAIGLSVFTVIGFQKGFMATHQYGISIVMGVITGVAGGIIRDVLSGEVPLILRREIYASASLIGAILYALFIFLKIPAGLTVAVAILAILAIRLAALRWKLTLPLIYPVRIENQEDN